MAPKSKKTVSQGKGLASSSATIAPGTAATASAVAFPDEVLPKSTAIGLAGGTGFSIPPRFPFLDPVPVLNANRTVELRRRVSEGHHLTLRELSIDAAMLSDQRCEMGKPDFMFGDAIAEQVVA